MAVNRMRKGADAITLAVSAIVGVAIVVFLFSVLGMGQQIAEFVQMFIFGQLSPGVASKELADAIECSYRRCTQGCAATKGITVEFPSGSVNCKTHCEAAVAAEGITDGKLCGEAAKDHPLIVQVSDQNMYISADETSYMTSCTGMKCCIVPADDASMVGLAMAFVIKSTLVKKVDLPQSGCFQSQQGPAYFPECKDSTTTNCAARTLTLQTGTYYVWSEEFGYGFGMRNIVWDSYTEPIKGGIFVCCSGTWYGGKSCTTGTLVDAAACEPGTSDGAAACAKKCTISGYERSFYEAQPRKEDYGICSCMTIPGYPTTTTTTVPGASTTSIATTTTTTTPSQGLE